MINRIDSTNFQCSFPFRRYSVHTPQMEPYEEFHFMPELQTKNQIKEFFHRIKKYFQNMIENVRGVRDAMKPEQDGVAKSADKANKA